MGRLYQGFLTVAPRCGHCHLDLAMADSGDGPAAFLILIVGAITVAGALVLDAAVQPPWWVHLVWIPVATALTLGGLRIGKAWLLHLEHKHRAREGRIQQ